MKTDKRSRKTIAAIQNTVLQLMCTRRIREIKIVDLCTAADINRTTFYLHFKSIPDVLESLQKELSQRIFNSEDFMRPGGFPKTGTLSVLKACTDAIDSYEYFGEFVRRSPDADVFLTGLKNEFSNQLFRRFEAVYGSTSAEAICIIRFLSGGVLDTYAEWLKSDKSISLEVLWNVCAPMVSVGQGILEKMTETKFNSEK